MKALLTDSAPNTVQILSDGDLAPFSTNCASSEANQMVRFACALRSQTRHFEGLMPRRSWTELHPALRRTCLC